MMLTNQGIDPIIRKITAEEAVEVTPQLWARLKSLPPDETLPQSKYIEILRYTARRILVKIEEAGFNADTWKSYTDFVTQAIVAYGTADMQSYLRIVERLLTAVLGFPSGAQPLLKEYLSCVVAQSMQRNAELTLYLAKVPFGEPPQLEQQPDLEYDGNFVACIEAKPVSEAMKILEQLPSQLTFAHRHAVIHLKLCNPLPIPGCAYVSKGYRCDTCHLRGIHVGFQAMLYDEEVADSGGTMTGVRSDAQISRRKTYGFDICMACAVTFYARQRDYLFALLRSPHKPYSFGHAAGVRISQTCYHTRRRAVSSSSSSPAFPLSRQQSGMDGKICPLLLVPTLAPVRRRLSGHSTSPNRSPSQHPVGDFCIQVATSTSSCGSSACSTDSATEKSGTAASQGGGAATKCFPPGRLPRRKMSHGRIAPAPPVTRCVTQDVVCITLNVTIAPYRARPIAWVLSSAEKFVHMNSMESVLLKHIGPTSEWRSSVKIESSCALRCRQATLTAQVANRQFPTRVGALSFQAPTAPPRGMAASPPSQHLGDSPRGLMSTMSPLLAKGVLYDNSAYDNGNTASDADEELCAICLCPFAGEEPVIETKCCHWFHVTCIEEYIRTAEDTCPLCRAEHVLPDMTRATALKHNAFKIELELTEEQRQMPYVDVCVGSMLTRDGNYHNATSIAAAQCMRIYPNQLRGYQEKSPLNSKENCPEK
ncbi:hypothetical protein ABL78_1598 [Leptomonas seymouri]|uniref:RING-type domain-containing protein n=1 Tax=Leptomonas seymouri TaxID=5684 RepID=A0A0N1I0D4_LEPSE|nr:hypothetical protein ABL78_1598 [Leptomonas seymouri]|eukprot:KPI89265.1 hypothetical protein ABL78_1598 [Leptomonas seymouri]